MNPQRRKFIKTTLHGAAVISAGAVLPSISAKSYASIMGANARVRVGMMGVYSRGLALAETFAAQPNAQVRILGKRSKERTLMH